MQFVRKFPEECCVEVSRGGDAQPCSKIAVAVALAVDEWDETDAAYPVCAHHARGRRMMSLVDLLDSLIKNAE